MSCFRLLNYITSDLWALGTPDFRLYQRHYCIRNSVPDNPPTRNILDYESLHRLGWKGPAVSELLLWCNLLVPPQQGKGGENRERDHSHIFQSLGAGPPPQRDSLCVGCGDLSQREQANSSARAHIRPPSAAQTGRVTLGSSTSTFSISFRVTEIQRNKLLLCKFRLFFAETLCYIPHFCLCDAVPSYLLEGYILSGFKSA